MEANQLPKRIQPDDEFIEVGYRYLSNAWGSKAEWIHHEKVTKVVYHHDNAHGERIFSIIGEDVPGYFTWVAESDIMFVHNNETRYTH